MPKSPEPVLDLTIRVVIVADEDRKSEWDTRDLLQDVDVVARVFEKAGVRTEAIISKVVKPEWCRATRERLPEMRGTRSGVPTLWLVDSLDFGGSSPTHGFAGFDAFLAYEPRMCSVNFAHELLHTFGLSHDERVGNVMRGSACGGENMTAEQIARFRKAVEVRKAVEGV